MNFIVLIQRLEQEFFYNNLKNELITFLDKFIYKFIKFYFQFDEKFMFLKEKISKNYKESIRLSDKLYLIDRSMFNNRTISRIISSLVSQST